MGPPVIQTASKINRFGLNFQSGTKDVNNKTDFITELNDVFYILYQLHVTGMFTQEEMQPNVELMAKKHEKVTKYMKVSQELGYLEY